MQPSISVVIAVRNEQKFLSTAIESVATQSLGPLEIIVVDDHSDDQTSAVLVSLASKHRTLSAHKNPGRGKCSAFNYGISLAKGDFICIFAGDDIMPPGSLRARLEAIKDCDPAVPTVGLSKLVTMSTDKRFDGHLVPKAPGKGALSGVSPLMNRAAVNRIFPVPEVLPNEDTWMELCVLHSPGLKVIHSDIICCQWRVHSGNSINMLVPFEVFNRKYTARMKAFALFADLHGEQLSDVELQVLKGKIECEERRSHGDWLGVLMSSCGIVDKLRALSLANSFFYGIRRRLYGLLSGW